MIHGINLTKEHNIKLIEMCKVLFPECLNVYINKEDGFIQGFTKLNENSQKCTISIHWFEFCMKSLFKKIFSNEDTEEYTEGPIDVTDYECHILGMFRYHPVNYLYKKFKKLN